MAQVFFAKAWIILVDNPAADIYVEAVRASVHIAFSAADFIFEKLDCAGYPADLG